MYYIVCTAYNHYCISLTNPLINNNLYKVVLHSTYRSIGGTYIIHNQYNNRGFAVVHCTTTHTLHTLHTLHCHYTCTAHVHTLHTYTTHVLHTLRCTLHTLHTLSTPYIHYGVLYTITTHTLHTLHILHTRPDYLYRGN